MKTCVTAVVLLQTVAAAQPMLGTWGCYGGNGNRSSSGFAPADVTTDGSVAWIFDASRMLQTPVVTIDGTVYVYAFEGLISNHTFEGLFALRGTDGSELWKLSLPLPAGWALGASPALASDGSILVAMSTSNTGTLFNISSTGSLQWTSGLPVNSCNTSKTPYETWPVIGPTGLTLVQASTSCQSVGFGFVAVDATGTVVWSYAATKGYGAISSMSFSGNGSLVFAMEYSKVDGHPDLVVLDAATGVVLLRPTVGSSVIPSPFSIRADGSIVFGWYNQGASGVTAITETGTKLWETSLFINSASRMLAIDAEGNVIAAAYHDVVKLAAANGTVIWKKTFTTDVLAPAIGGDGTIYIVSGVVIFALDGNTGDIRWQASQSTQPGVPVLDPTGRVLSAAINNALTVYAAVRRQ
jgi:hypothetical protein